MTFVFEKNEALKSCLSLLENIDTLIKYEDKTFNFSKLKSELLNLKNIFEIVVVHYDHFEYYETNLNNFFQNFLSNLTNMRNFNPLSGNPNDNITRISNEFKSYLKSYRVLMNEVLTYGLTKKLEKSNLSDLETNLKEKLSLVDENEKESTKILENLKSTSQDVGLVKYTQIFSDESNENFELANKFWEFWSKTNVGKWFFVIIFPIFIILFNLIILNNVGDGKVFEVLKENIIFFIVPTNFLLFSIYFYVFSQLFKQYNSYLHLAKTNKHKANCLGVVEAFVDSSSSNETKEQIRLMATQTIFESGETGIVKSGGGDNGNNINLNIFEKMLKNGGNN